MLCLTTCPDRESALAIARQLVEHQLAACVNVLPGIASIYRWQRELHEDSEVQLLIKTTQARLAELKEALPRIHPYDVPELIALEVTDGLPAYLEWVAANCMSNAMVGGN